MTEPVLLFPQAFMKGVRPRRVQAKPATTPATTPQSAALKLTLATAPPGCTARNIQLLVPDDELPFVTEQLARYGHSLGEVAQVNSCIALAVLEENERTGKPLMVSYIGGKFKITLMDEIPVKAVPPPQSRWRRLMFWRR